MARKNGLAKNSTGNNGTNGKVVKNGTFSILGFGLAVKFGAEVQGLGIWENLILVICRWIAWHEIKLS